MVTFNVGIGKEDVQEAVLLPEDWYTVEITKAYEAKNSAWMNAGEKLSLDDAHAINEKAGKNIVLNMKIVSEVPEFSGRTLTKWLPLPNKFDEGRWTNNGQPVPDWKAETAHKWSNAFGGGSEGANVNFAEKQKAMIYVIQDTAQDGETLQNAVSMNVDPRPIGAGETSPEGDTGFLDDAEGGLL